MLRAKDVAAVFTVLMIASSAGGADPLSDREITESLQRALELDYRLRDAELQASTLNGSVTLQGTVGTFMDKDAAEQLAKRIAGVRAIVNMIVVDPSAVDDRRISDDIRGRIARSSFIRTGDLEAEVRNGNVTLHGTVTSWEESEQIERVTREVRGVRDVVNQLRPRQGTSHRNDDRIAAEVEEKLARDAYLAGYALEVTVESGILQLLGEVPNLFHKERAENEAKSVMGLRRVDNQLVVVSQAIFQSLAEPPSDRDLERLVHDELHADPRVPTDGISISALRGEISLAGEVDSMFAKQTAARVARQVFGVARVRNELAVHPTTRSDEAILADLLSNLISDSMLEGQHIDVTVKNGLATLSGEVTSSSVKYHALRVAARVSGVRDITNNLRVVRRDPVSDDAIARYIVGRLKANGVTRAVADRIAVAVDQGQVILTGSVDRRSQAIEAARISRTTTGVRAVRNRLQIRP